MSLRQVACFLTAFCVAPGGIAQSITSTAFAITSGGVPIATIRQGTEVTLTATVTLTGGAAAAPPGQVEFCEVKAQPLKCTDIRQLGIVQLSSTGTAVYRFFPGAGTHSYQAVFLGTNIEAASSSIPSALIVTPFYPTITSITSTGSPGDYTLTATVTGSEGTVPPTGTLSFVDTTNANYVLAAAPLVPVPATVAFQFGSANPPTTQLIGLIVEADLNGDGKPDLIATVDGGVVPKLTDGSVIPLLGNGDGTFTPAPITSVLGITNITMAVADFNGDGKPDIVLSTEHTQGDGGQIQVLLGNGDGTFTAGQTLPANGGGAFITSGDFNGDGVEDLAVANGFTATVDIYLGSGDGTFRVGPSTPAYTNNGCTIMVGDWNGDGIADLAALNPQDSATPGQLVILLGNGDGTFRAAPSISTGPVPGAMTAADLNGDGILDLATDVSVGNGSNQALTVLLGNGDGTFTPQPLIPIATGSASIAYGDFNGDGIADLVIGNGGAEVSVLLGKGDGTFASALILPARSNPANPVATADFNGDGLSDIAAVNNSNQSASMNHSVAVFLSELGPQSATATVSSISPVGNGGLHYVDASYSGDSAYQPSVSGTIPLIAEPEPNTLVLTANPTSSNYGQRVTLTATLAPNAAQNHLPTGTVTFTDGSTIIGTAPIASGVVTFDTTLLPTGTDSLTATYSGDANFAASTSPAVTENVAGYASATSLAVAPNPAFVGQTVTLTAAVAQVGTAYSAAPTGSVNFYDGTKQIAQVILDATGHAAFTTSTLTIGTHALTAAYAGDAAYYVSASPATALVVNILADTTALTVSPNPAGVGQTVTLSATVAGTGYGSATAPTGAIAFYDGTALLASAALDATGHATYATAALALGTHPLTAVYAGSAVFAGSTSATVNEILVKPDFAIALSTPSLTLQTYHHATVSLTLTSLGNFADTVAIACGSPPTYVTCIFTPNPATLTGNATATVSLYLDTDSILGGDARSRPGNASLAPRPSRFNLAVLLSPFGLFAALAARRRRPPTPLLLLAVLSTATVLALASCGGSIVTAVPSTTPGTYTLPITATGTATGLAHTAQLTLTVTP